MWFKVKIRLRVLSVFFFYCLKMSSLEVKKHENEKKSSFYSYTMGKKKKNFWAGHDLEAQKD